MNFNFYRISDPGNSTSLNEVSGILGAGRDRRRPRAPVPACRHRADVADRWHGAVAPGPGPAAPRRGLRQGGRGERSIAAASLLLAVLRYYGSALTWIPSENFVECRQNSQHSGSFRHLPSIIGAHAGYCAFLSHFHLATFSDAFRLCVFQLSVSSPF